MYTGGSGVGSLRRRGTRTGAGSRSSSAVAVLWRVAGRRRGDVGTRVTSKSRVSWTVRSRGSVSCWPVPGAFMPLARLREAAFRSSQLLLRRGWPARVGARGGAWGRTCGLCRLAWSQGRCRGWRGGPRGIGEVSASGVRVALRCSRELMLRRLTPAAPCSRGRSRCPLRVLPVRRGARPGRKSHRPCRRVEDRWPFSGLSAGDSPAGTGCGAVSMRGRIGMGIASAGGPWSSVPAVSVRRAGRDGRRSGLGRRVRGR